MDIKSFLNKNSLKIKIFKYLIIFSVLILLLLWFLQVIFLNTYYETFKTNELNKALNKIIKNYNSDNFFYILDETTYNAGICIEIVDRENSIIYSTDAMNKGCISSRENNHDLSLYKLKFIISGKDQDKVKMINPRYNNKTLIYSAKLDKSTYVFTNTSLVPLESTIVILKNQLLIVSFVVLVLSTIVAYLISKRVSTPLSKLNNTAKMLGNNNFDITFNENYCSEISELSNTLNYAKEKLEQNDVLRRELMANVSHDLKTPLTMIKAYAEMVKDFNYKDENKRNDNLNIIIDETDRLSNLVNDILALSKLESNILKLQKEKFDLVELTNQIINHYQIYSLTNNYEFIFESPNKIIVNLDKKKIEQVLYNLINNAINYTGEDKKIYIKITDNKVIRIEITDTGKGIKKNDLDKIWDKYYQVEKNHQRNTIGTGLGLFIVKKIFILHNINYGVNSTVNKGTTFYFEIKK